MQTIKIKEQSIDVSSEKYEIFTDLLKLLNIKYAIEVKTDIDVVLVKYGIGGKVRNIVREIRKKNPEIVSVQDFVEKVTKNDLSKMRSCGRKTITELDMLFEDLGLYLRKI